jgi:YD repeat-containing protein
MLRPDNLRFTRPAQITLPNIDHHPPGALIDLWAHDHEQLTFTVVGQLQVSPDGQSMNTVSGGIMSSGCQGPGGPGAGPGGLGGGGCGGCDCGGSMGSTGSFLGGNLRVDYTLPSYRSLNVARALQFHYNSLSADPRPILTADVPKPTNTTNPTTISAHLIVNGMQQPDVFYTQVAPLPAMGESAQYRVALQFNALQTGLNLSTGAYPLTMEAFNNYAPPNGGSFGAAAKGTVLVNNERSSPFGAGWTLDGLQRLYQLTDPNAIVLTEGDGNIKRFARPTNALSFPTRKDFAAGTNPNQVAVADFNGDGFLDVAVTNNSGTVSILLGDGAGNFTLTNSFSAVASAGLRPLAIVTGDFNEDGKVDLAVTNIQPDGSTLNGSVLIFLGDGGGGFAAGATLTVGQRPLSMTTGDFNNDGHLDLAVANKDSNNVSIWLGNGNGTFGNPATVAVGAAPVSIVAGQLNPLVDGILDLAVANQSDRTYSILLGTGTVPSGFVRTDYNMPQCALGNCAPGAIALGDFNSDKIVDLAITDLSFYTVRIFLGDGLGRFNVTQCAPTGPDPCSFGAQPMGVISGDFNADAIPDLAVAFNGAGQPAWVQLVLGNGNGTFRAPANPSPAYYLSGAPQGPDGPAALASGDFNGDGLRDIVSANSFPNNVSVLLGASPYGFTQTSNYGVQSSGAPQAMTTADFNGDGKPDVAVGLTQTNTIRIMAGTGGIGVSHFTVVGSEYSVGTTPVALVSGDFNNDKSQDLAVANKDSNNVSILLGNGNGTFQAATQVAITGFTNPPSPRAITAGLFHNATNLDLAVANYNSISPTDTKKQISILLGNGLGGFTVNNISLGPGSTGYNPQGIVSGDFNGDGKADLAVTLVGTFSPATVPGMVFILLGNGDGTFQSPVAYAVGVNPTAIITGDFNGDKRPDLAVLNTTSNTVSVLYGNGDGSFGTILSFPVGLNPVSLVSADLNGDGLPDLAVANHDSSGVSILLADATSGFVPWNGYFGVVRGPQAIVAGDFDQNNPNIDLVTANEGHQTVSVLINNAKAKFSSSNFVAPSGDYSKLLSNLDGTFTRTMPDGTRINFDTQGKQTSVVDRNGNTTNYAYYPASGNLSSITDPVGLVTSFAYTPTGLTVTDPAGRVTTFTLGAGQLTQIQDPTGAITSFQYDSNSRLTQQTNPRNITTQYSYNFAGRLVQSIVPWVQPLPPEAITRQLSPVQIKGLVDTVGCGCGTAANPAPLTKTADVNATFTDGRTNTTKYTTDPFGASTSIIDPLARVTTITRDANSNPIRTTAANGAVTTSSYDGRGNQVSQIDALGNITAYTYHPTFNQVTLIVDPNRNRTTFDYDDTVNCYSPPFASPPARGNLCRMTDAMGNKTEYTYNSQGLVVTVTAGTGLATTNYTYNARGNLATIVDPLGRRTTYGYLNADGTEDLTRNIRSVMDAFQLTTRVTKYTYDLANRLLTVTDTAQGTTTYTYLAGCQQGGCGGGSSGLLRTITDAKNQTTTFDYDTLGRLIKVTNPLTQFRQFAYDPADNLTQVTNIRGQVITFAYDAANQRTSKNVAGSGLTCYYYDSVGNMTLVKSKVSTNCGDPNATFESGLSFGYNLINRQTSAQTLSSTGGQPVTSINYSYDANSNRLTMVDTQNGITSTTNYTYDTLNRVVSLKNPLNQTTSFNYDALSRRTGVTYPVPTLQGTMTYDAASQLTSLAYLSGASNIVTFNYQQYDAVGNRTTITQQDGTSPVGTNTYAYDNLSRETGATHPQPPTINPTESFTYDAVGNRLSSHLSANYTYNAANRLTADATFAYQYDADGNLTSKCQGTACTTYTYDPENLLAQIVLSSGTTISYKYDGLGRRIEKNEGGTITRYVYDNANILETFSVVSGSNVLQQRFTHRLDMCSEPLKLDTILGVLSVAAPLCCGSAIDDQI